MGLTKDEQAYLKRLGAYVVMLREESSMKQYELADLLDVDVRVVRRLEKGETNPQIVSLLRFAVALNVKPEEFLYL